MSVTLSEEKHLLAQCVTEKVFMSSRCCQVSLLLLKIVSAITQRPEKGFATKLGFFLLFLLLPKPDRLLEKKKKITVVQLKSLFRAEVQVLYVKSWMVDFI